MATHRNAERGPTGEPQSLRHSRLVDLLLWLLRRRLRLRVAGRSMLPLLQPGTEVLVDPCAYRSRTKTNAAPLPPQPGDIVVAYLPQAAASEVFPERRIIKWVVFVEEDGRCYLKGLNPEESTDSRCFGLVPPEAILGRVVCRLP